jgi:diphosphomevalonate decarboxylase
MTSQSMTVRARVPGKLMLAGEYAVLGGGQALAVAMNRYLTVTATRGAPESGIVIASPLWQEPLRITATTAVPPVAQPFATAATLLAARYGLADVQLTADGGLDVSHGMGSSSALRLGTALALARLAGHPTSENEAARAAYDLQKNDQGVASGYDVITQQYGGIVACSPCAPGVTWPGSVRPLPQDGLERLAARLAVFVGGRGAPTGPVARDTVHWLSTHGHTETLSSLSESMVRALVGALATDHADAWHLAYAAIGAHRRLFEHAPHAPRLVHEALCGLPGLDVTSAYKTTGAGGEDAILVFGDDAAHAAAEAALTGIGWHHLRCGFSSRGAEVEEDKRSFTSFRMTEGRYVARAPSNIALIKYWGKRDVAAQWPANDSLSMTLSAAHTLTAAEIRPGAPDRLVLNGEALDDADPRARKALGHVARLRALIGAAPNEGLLLTSENSFPSDAGIASSASGFAALTIAALAAFTRSRDLADLAAKGYGADHLAALARRGSGSACRSLHGGYVHWHAGETPAAQGTEPLFTRADEAWRLADIIVILSRAAKPVGSSEAHQAAWGSEHFEPRLAALPARLAAVKAAIAKRDLRTLGALIELEADEMHRVMETGTPPVNYRLDDTHACRTWLAAERQAGRLDAYMTLDAGPNPHVICSLDDAAHVATAIAKRFPTADLLLDQTGDGPELVYLEGT